MKQEIGKAYEIAPGWFVALKSAKRAIIIHRVVWPNPGYDEGDEKWSGPREWVSFITAAKDTSRGPGEWGTLEEAVNGGEWEPWPNVWALPQTHGYNMEEALETVLQAIPDSAPIDFRRVIGLIGHYKAYTYHVPEKPGRSEAYWAAAAKLKPGTSSRKVMDFHATDVPTNPGEWSEWALRLAYLNGRPLSADELVSLCTSEQQTTREFALTASAGEKPPTARTKSRRKV